MRGGKCAAGFLGLAVLDGVVIYEIAKWGLAIILASETLGSSIGIAAATP